MKKLSLKLRVLSAIAAASVLFGVIAVLANQNPDSKAVEELSATRLFEGDENGDLRLSDNITRAEFSKLISEAGFTENKKEIKFLGFDDVPKKHWAYEYIKNMTEAGLISGYGDGRFGPQDNITLIQAERIILRAYLGYDPKENTDCAALALDIGLADNVKSLHYEAITREDAANIIYNLISLKETEQIESETQRYSISTSKASSVNMSFSGGSGGGGSAIAMPSAKSECMSEDGSVAFMPAYTEKYSSSAENIFKDALLSPLSTFSIDTDTASYSNMRRFILQGRVPEKGSVRTEELINYFSYENNKPQSGEVFGVTTETGICPWNENNLLVRVSIQGEEMKTEERAPQNLVFLIDVSGSMHYNDKLPLVKRSMSLLLEKLDERDRISIVTYASGTSVVLEGATGAEKERVMNAINSLRSGGGTSGAAGLTLAYEQAEKFKIDGNNRIILCTDGDFNVGISSEAELKSLVEEKRNGGIFLSIMGFGTGNLKDNKLEIMADNGNGSYYYIDNLKEAKKVLADDLTKTLYTIAKDVKLQVEFNPNIVKEYRLIGYENRMLQTEDFINDAKDAGELGAGSTVTAFYEIVPADENVNGMNLRYQTAEVSDSNELMCVSIRYKEPHGTESILKEYPVACGINENLSDDFNFAASVSMLGMILNNSEYKNGITYDNVIELADNSRGEDYHGYRSEFISLVDLLRMLDK